jgi:Uncharacterized flavoproteins
MNKYALPEISDNVFWVGIKDWNRRLFDALIPLPQGTSYNAYSFNHLSLLRTIP